MKTESKRNILMANLAMFCPCILCAIGLTWFVDSCKQCIAGTLPLWDTVELSLLAIGFASFLMIALGIIKLR
jgi:hypothetical protein